MWHLECDRKFGRGKEGLQGTRHTTPTLTPDFHTYVKSQLSFSSLVLTQGVTTMQLFTEHKILGGTWQPSVIVLLPAQTWGGCAALWADSGHLLKSNPTRSCLWNTLLRPKSVFLQFPPISTAALSPPSVMFKCWRLRGIFHWEQGKCAWPMLQHTPLSQQMDTVKGLSPAPQSRLINSSLKW